MVVFERSESTTPSKVTDVEFPLTSGAKYIVVLLLIVEAEMSVDAANLKSAKSYPTGIFGARITNLSFD